MSERVYNFGENRALLGIYSTPHDTPDNNLPTVILLNAGLLHHVGQNRLNVTLARRLSGIGYPTFRFDFSGLGDSVAQNNNLSVQERNVVEVREALDFLQQRKGAVSFILVGLCTGADNAHRSAVADPRVRGIVMMDGYAYVTVKYIIRRFRKKVLSPKRWINFLVYKVFNRHQRDHGDKDARAYFWTLPKKSKVVGEVKELANRGVRQLQVFSGSNIRYNYPEQYADALSDVDFDDLLRTVYAEQSDHTYSRLDDRNYLISEIADWLDSGFRSAQPGSR